MTKPSAPPPPVRRHNAVQTLVAVAWSFFGVRRSAEYQRDIENLKPAQLIVGGIIGGLLFVLAIVLLVRWVVRSGVAA